MINKWTRAEISKPSDEEIKYVRHKSSKKVK